jgi:hypothetical protein
VRAASNNVIRVRAASNNVVRVCAASNNVIRVRAAAAWAQWILVRWSTSTNHTGQPKTTAAFSVPHLLVGSAGDCIFSQQPRHDVQNVANVKVQCRQLPNAGSDVVSDGVGIRNLIAGRWR